MDPKVTFGEISAFKVIFEDEKGNIKTLFEAKKEDYLPDLFNINYSITRGVKRKYSPGSLKSRIELSGEMGFDLHFTGQRKPGKEEE